MSKISSWAAVLLLAAFSVLVLAVSVAVDGQSTPAGSTETAKATPAAASAEIKVQLKDSQGTEITLKPEEKLAFLFMEAISAMETDCHYGLHRPCSLEELVKGPKSAAQNIGRLKFDPAEDPNYQYTITISSEGWEGRADPKHAGLGGLFYDGKNRSMARSYFNAKGTATSQNTALGDATVLGSFRVI